MRVWFDPAVFDDTSSFAHLDDTIPRLFETGRNVWVVEDPEGIRDSVWYAGLGDRKRGRVELCLDSPQLAYRKDRVTVRITHQPQGTEWCVTPADIQRQLMGPLRIVVENARDDGAFLRAVLLKLGGEALRDRLDEPELQRLLNAWTPGDLGEYPVTEHLRRSNPAR